MPPLSTMYSLPNHESSVFLMLAGGVEG
jgi:hypothetical protein